MGSRCCTFKLLSDSISFFFPKREKNKKKQRTKNQQIFILIVCIQELLSYFILVEAIYKIIPFVFHSLLSLRCISILFLAVWLNACRVLVHFVCLRVCWGEFVFIFITFFAEQKIILFRNKKILLEIFLGFSSIFRDVFSLSRPSLAND